MKFKLGKEIQLETVAIRVKNRDKMIQFYRDLIGFTLQREENELAIMGTAAPKNESLWLEESPRAEDFFGEVKKLQRICLTLPNLAEIAEIFQRLKKANYPIEDALQKQQEVGILLKDPEGNQLELVAPQENPEGEIQPLDESWLLTQVTGEYPRLSADAVFAKVHLNTSDFLKESQFLSQFLGFTIKDETKGIHVLNEGVFHVGLREAQGGTVDLTTDKVLGLDFLKFSLPAEDLQAFISHLKEENLDFYQDKKGKIVTIYDPIGIEWWFVRQG